MRRIAAHRIILPDGRVFVRHVAVLNDGGHLISLHPLQGEEPFTEWLPGDYHITEIERT